MGKRRETRLKRTQLYRQARQVTELEAAELNDRANGNWNVRSMWDGISGIGQDGQWIGATPRIVGKSMRMSYYNGRAHAHPAFTGRSGRVRTVQAPMNK
jgi:hypothetical protein